ncbi:MAG: ribosome maturation factor RimM [Sphaerochaetaceae bacterium]|nr:ribosome maturation factor RimM [Sphaerochaetaceae bacterium]
MKQILATGVVRAPHGVRGLMKVHPYADDVSHFADLHSVTLSKDGRTKSAEIEEIQDFCGEFLVKFKGIDNPEDGRLISGWEILVPREQASKLGEGEVYIADLVGMRLLYNNEEVGNIVSVLDGAQAPLLEVMCRDGKKRLVPFLKGIYVSDVDLESETVKLLVRELVE